MIYQYKKLIERLLYKKEMLVSIQIIHNLDNYASLFIIRKNLNYCCKKQLLLDNITTKLGSNNNYLSI